MVPGKTSVVAVSAAMITGGHALCPWGFGGYAAPCGAQFIGADEQVWIDAVEASNSSGTYTFPGYDVSKPWPGTPMDGWTISKTALDLSNEDRGESGSILGGRAVVGADIKITAPESLYVPSKNASDHGKPIVNAHPDWIFCAWRWYLPAYGNKTQATNPDNLELPEDGSCAQWLPDECIKALEKVASTSYWINSEPEGTYGSRHRCFELEVPDECKDTKLEDNKPLLPTWGVPLEYLNGSTTWQSGFTINENTTVEDTQEMWKTQTESYHPIVTMFGRYDNNSESLFDVEPGFAKLSCVRALPAKGQSNSGNSDGKGNGSGGDNDGGNRNGNGTDSNGDEDNKSGATKLGTQGLAIIFSVALVNWLMSQ